MPIPSPSPRTFDSPTDAVHDLAGVVRRARPLAAAYRRGGLEPDLRERVLVAVSRVNSCGGCTFVHESWAKRAGVSQDDLEAIGLGDLGELDDRNRAAVAYAAAIAEGRGREPVPADLAASAADQLTPDELAAVDAVARAMALANLSANTVEELLGRPARPQLPEAAPVEPGQAVAFATHRTAVDERGFPRNWTASLYGWRRDAAVAGSANVIHRPAGWRAFRKRVLWKKSGMSR